MKSLLITILFCCALNVTAQNLNLLRNGSWRPGRELNAWKTGDTIYMKRPYADSTGDLNFTVKGDIQQFHSGRSSVLRGNKYVVHNTTSWDIIGQYTLDKILSLSFERKTIVTEIVTQSQTQMVLRIKSIQPK